MAKVSKTNVSARREQKSVASVCKFCGNKVEVILSVPVKGKKRFRRLCCGE